MEREIVHGHLSPLCTSQPLRPTTKDSHCAAWPQSSASAIEMEATGMMQHLISDGALGLDEMQEPCGWGRDALLRRAVSRRAPHATTSFKLDAEALSGNV